MNEARDGRLMDMLLIVSSFMLICALITMLLSFNDLQNQITNNDLINIGDNVYLCEDAR